MKKDKKYFTDLISKHCSGMYNSDLLMTSNGLEELVEILSSQLEPPVSRRFNPYLGYANGWSDEPEIVKNCKHEKQEYKLREFNYMVVCEECGFFYKYDSSG